MTLLDILSNFNLPSFAIEVAMLVVAIIVMNMTTKKAFEEKFDKKADVVRVKKIEDSIDKIDIDMDCIKEKKAEVDYVDKQIRAVYHSMKENNDNVKIILSQIQSGQNIMEKDIKEILKTMPRK